MEFALHLPDSPRDNLGGRTGMKNLAIKFTVSAAHLLLRCWFFLLLLLQSFLLLPRRHSLQSLPLALRRDSGERRERPANCRSRKGVFWCMKLRRGDKTEMASIWMGWGARADCCKSELRSAVIGLSEPN